MQKMIEKCLIIGLGKIGFEYDLKLDPTTTVYTHTRAFSLHPSFELAGAVDLSNDKRDLFVKYYHKPAYSDLKEALTKEKPGIVIIAVPTFQHISIIKEILTCHKPKTILCEKPLAYSLSDAREIVQLCKNNSVKLFVNYIRRSDPGVIEIRNRIKNGQISGPIKAVVWYSKGFFHNGSHFFNLLEFWLGSYIDAKIMDSGRDISEQDSEPDLFIEFELGKAAFMAAWEESFSYYTIELLSSSGRLRYEQEGRYISWQSTRSDPDFNGYSILNSESEIIQSGMAYYQWHVVDQLAKESAGKLTSLCTGDQALKTLEAMHNILGKR